MEEAKISMKLHVPSIFINKYFVNEISLLQVHAIALFECCVDAQGAHTHTCTFTATWPPVLFIRKEDEQGEKYTHNLCI